jgi:endonuclease/exonuclease/phosphatase family metal-dependent hydrolase
MESATARARVREFVLTPEAELRTIWMLLLGALTTTILLQATRVFLSNMVFIIDQSERVQLGVTAGGVYLAIALGAVLPRMTGLQRAALLVTIGMVTTRVILQFWALPEARMWLGAATIVLAGWLMPILLTLARKEAAYGIGLGLALDVALRLGRDTVDLPFIPGLTAHGITLIMGILAVFGAVRLQTRQPSVATGGLAISALAFGPALALHHLVIGNLGAVQLRLDMGLSAGAWLVSSGMILGLTIDIFLSNHLARSRPHFAGSATFVVAMIGLGAVGLVVFWQDLGGLGPAGLVAGTAATLALIVIALRGGSSRVSASATALWLTLGLLIHAVLLFAYFTATGYPLLIVVLYAIVALVALLTLWRPPATGPRSPVSLGGLAAVAGALLVASVSLSFRADAPDADEPLPVEFTTMTYNIQAGFSVENYWDLEEIAQVIEAENPEVVMLQEVGRGWPVMVGADQAEWLSNRLDMQLVWGPASRDDLWGNAILTRAPIISTDWVKFDTTENLRRGAVVAVLESAEGTITVISTHLDNPRGATAARQEQVAQLVELWDGAEPAVIGGDFNADPDSETILALVESGLGDTGEILGVEATTSEDDRRIDYVLVTPGLEVVSSEIPDTWASDHRPFVTTLRVMP